MSLTINLDSPETTTLQLENDIDMITEGIYEVTITLDITDLTAGTPARRYCFETKRYTGPLNLTIIPGPLYLAIIPEFIFLK